MKTTLTTADEQRALVLKTFPHPLELRTPRCLLRQWQDRDLPAWVAMNADPAVRRYFSSIQTEEEALGEAQRIRNSITQRGWGMWALEIPGKLPFAGFVGLHVPTFDAPFMPCVETGWRLPQAAWGQGYAIEAAQAAAAFAFDVLALEEILAYTRPDNAASRRVMQRLGMTHNSADDFDHPMMAADHPMRRQVLYRLRRHALQQ
jgi:RimJ/RimL family protein N-acetyltransferase